MKSHPVITTVVELASSTPAGNKPGPFQTDPVNTTDTETQISQENNQSAREKRLPSLPESLGATAPIEPFNELRKKIDDNIKATPKNFKTATLSEQIQSIKIKLSPHIKSELLDSYFEKQENITEISEQLQSGKESKHILRQLQDRLVRVWNNFKEDPSRTTDTPSNYSTPLGNIVPPNKAKPSKNLDLDLADPESDTTINNNNNQEMAPQVKTVSLKDTLDLIPRFNGNNVPLTQFIDGCMEASEILPAGYEAEFARLIRMRLFGDALCCARGHKFKNIEEIVTFFEKNFGSAKTFHELTGELAKVKQRPTESVVVYTNRLRDVENKIKKAATREQRYTDLPTYEKELEKDCIKFFIRGLRWEIQTRMGSPDTLEKAREKAIEIERDFAYTGEFEERRDETRSKQKETRRVNLIEDLIETTCNFCNEPGHVAMNCTKFLLQINKNAREGWNSNNYSRPTARENDYRGPPSRENNYHGPTRNQNQNDVRRDNGFNYPRYPRRDGPQGMPTSFNRNNDNNFNNGVRPNNREGPEQSHYRSNTNGNNMRNLQNNNDNVNSTNGTGNNRVSGIVCYYCQRPGHYKRDCYKLARDTREGNVAAGNGHGIPQSGKGEANDNARPTQDTRRETSTSSTRPQST